MFSNNLKKVWLMRNDQKVWEHRGEIKKEQEVLKVAIFIILKLCTGNQRHQSAKWYKDQVFLQLAC